MFTHTSFGQSFKYFELGKRHQKRLIVSSEPGSELHENNPAPHHWLQRNWKSTEVGIANFF
jgi:hypothetical protein